MRGHTFMGHGRVGKVRFSYARRLNIAPLLAALPRPASFSLPFHTRAAPQAPWWPRSRRWPAPPPHADGPFVRTAAACAAYCGLPQLLCQRVSRARPWPHFPPSSLPLFSHPGYFGKVGMRHFHLKKNPGFVESINVDKVRTRPRVMEVLMAGNGMLQSCANCGLWRLYT